MTRGEGKEETTIKGLIGGEGSGYGREEMWIPLRLQEGVVEEVL
jgi:hypothetical protein